MSLRIAALLLLLASLSLAATQDHPFARSTEPSGLDLSFGRLEWGKTTLAYSQAWTGGRSLSQGLLLKDIRAPLARGLEFNARFGMAFSPGSGLQDGGDQPEFVIPFAALNWQPSENFMLRLEYSRPGLGTYPMEGYWADRRFPSLLPDRDAESQP